MAQGARPEVRYTAFLSYSHRDAAAAGRLHRRLEAYRLPKRLAGKATARGPVPDRLWPIFRDREELPAATDLSQTVRAALAESGALVILCSAHAATSLWVAEEIETFRKLHPDRPILAAILDGDPPDCFPAALRAFGRDGTWHEPLATDLRREGDGAHLGLLKLVAGITGVGLDELVQRDAARRIRRVMAVTAAAVVAMLIMAALAVVALNARRDAERQRADAEGLVEFMLTDLRTKLEGVGRLDVMNTVNLRALSYYDRQLERHDPRTNLAMRARVILMIGDDSMRGGDMPGALARFREAHAATTALIVQSPDDPDRIFAHAQSEYWMGYFNYQRGDRAAAIRFWERYDLLAGRLLAMDADNPQWLREVGYARGNICTIDMRPPVDPAGALRACSVALHRMVQAWRLQGANPSLTGDLANRHAWMALALVANRRWALAEAHQRRHEALVQSLIDSDPGNLDHREVWMASQYGFGMLLAERGRHEQARLRFANAARMAATLRERDPANASWRNWETRIAQARQGEEGR